MFDYTGGKFSGYERDPNVDEYERKEHLRMNRRKPIGETLEQLGEGRGKPLAICESYVTDVSIIRYIRPRI